MWAIISSVILSVLVTGFVWMASVIRENILDRWFPAYEKKSKWVSYLPLALLLLLLYFATDLVNMVIIFLHLVFFTWICSIIGTWMENHSPHRKWKSYYPLLCALLLTSTTLFIGWQNAHMVQATHYQLTTHKEITGGHLKIVGLSDSHVGATFHWQEFEKQLQTIQQENPDMVVVMGDFVDDDTSKEDMEKSCQALGKLNTRYGVYLVYGNHDEGYWDNRRRGYTLADMDSCLEHNHVNVLRDETFAIDNHTYLCGRLDKTRSLNRKSASALMAGRQPTDYVITLDHQPNDYTAETESGMDLVLSGHTHGGQFIGLGPLGVWMGANDAYYGHEKRGNTDFIVSSGIGDWALQFKTGCIAEYIVIDIDGQQ